MDPSGRGPYSPSDTLSLSVAAKINSDCSYWRGTPHPPPALPTGRKMIICWWNRLLTCCRIASPPQGIYRYSLWCINIYLKCDSLGLNVRLSGWLAGRGPALGQRRTISTSDPLPSTMTPLSPTSSVSVFFRGDGKLLWFHPAVNSETFFPNYILWPLSLENHCRHHTFRGKKACKLVFVEPVGSWQINIDVFCCIKKNDFAFQPH